MTIAINMVLITVCSIFIAIIFNKSVEEILPLSIFSIALILLPFYCLNLLLVGKYFIYAMMILIVIAALIYIKKQNIKVFKEFFKKITPGICIFAVLCLFFLLYVRSNYVGLWDELRLWGAVPKALHSTNQLQLGNDVLIFKNMQSYPPGMSLFVYFLISFAPNFAEYHVFAAYGILTAAVFLPALKGLKWKQWQLFVPFGFVLAFAPCIFTSHNSDHSAFYESLFIDGILGIIIGYVFYLAAKKPFNSKFDSIRFLLTVAFLINLKHSAISFAIVACICAIVLYIIENKNSSLKHLVVSIISTIISIASPYLIWSITTKVYGVSNHLSMDASTFSAVSLKLLFEKMLKEPMLDLTYFNNTLTLSFLSCVVLMVFAYCIINAKYKCTNKISTAVIGSGIGLSFIMFSVGYISIFPLTLLSYNRYYTTLLYVLFTFIFYNFCEVFLNGINIKEHNSVKPKKVFKVICSIALSFLIVCFGCYHFKNWQYKKNERNIYSQARIHSEKMLNTISTSEESKTYLLISGDKYQNSLLHHRIYFDLIGSEVRVANYYDEVNITCEESFDENLSKDEFKKVVEKWSNNLLQENYEYIYNTSVDELTLKTFNELSVIEAPKVGDVYKISNANEKIQLTLVE